VRCFIGSILSEDDQRRLSALRPDLNERDVRWVNPSKYHLTLQFLGNDVKREDLVQHWTQVNTWRSRFPITCTSVSFSGFPNRRRARVFVSLLDSCGRLEALRPEQRLFLPHITLGYARGKPIDIPDWSANVSITIPEPTLIESSQGKYKILEPEAR